MTTTITIMIMTTMITTTITTMARPRRSTT